MNEAHVRKWHRRVGLIIAVLALFQVLTGIILSVENLIGTYWGGIIHDVHEGFGGIGNTIRLLLGCALTWMIASGWMIYRAVRRRTRR